MESDTAENQPGVLVLVLLQGPPTPLQAWVPLPSPAWWGREINSDLEEERQHQCEAGRTADAVADQQEAPSPQPLNGESLEEKGRT